MSEQSDAGAAPTRQVAVSPPAPPREVRVVGDVQPLFDTARFEHFQRVGRALMYSTLLPESVRGNSPDACFSNLMMVFDQADRWALPALAVAQCVSIVHGKLVYEGKLIAAVVEARLGVRLDYQWTDHPPGDDRYGIRVFGTRPGETEPREIRGTVRDWATSSKSGGRNPNWVGAASTMQLAYRGAREWIRLWAPALLLGVYGDDELEAYEDRRVAAMSTASGPAITAGFASQPVADPAPAVDAEFEEGDRRNITADEAQGSPRTGGKPATSEPTAGAGAPADASQGAADGDKSSEPPKETAAAKKKREAAEAEGRRRAVIEEAQERGYAARSAGEPETANPYGPQEEAHNVWRNRWIDRDEEMQAEASALGVDDDDRGQAADADAGHASDGGGQLPPGVGAAGLEEAMGGPKADEAKAADQAAASPAIDEVIDEGDAGDPPAWTAFDFFSGGLKDCVNWGAVKTSLAALSRTDDWRNAARDPMSTAIRQARIGAWCRVLELQAAGSEAVDFINDITAFRCWAEHCEDAAVITARWEDVVESPTYGNLQPPQKEQLEAGVRRRLEALRPA